MKYFRFAPIILFFFVFDSFSYSQEKIELPASKAREEIIHHEYYSISFIEAYELSSWVAYELTDEMLNGNVSYKEKFIEDPLVSTGSATMKDYKDAGYILGQLVPVEDMLVSEKAAEETFYLSNVVPMKPAFHKYTWRQISNMVREWTQDAGKMYIVAGSVLADAPFPTFGPNMVSIPLRYYKVILDVNNERGMGFVVKNSISSGSMKPYAMSIDKVEEITGIDFFPGLDDDLENKIESTFDSDKWDFEVLKK